MFPKFVQLLLVVIAVSSFVPSVEPCPESVVKDVFNRINSYKGNKYVIYGPELCQNSMILECKNAELERVDLVDMKITGLLPLERSRFLDFSELAAKPPQKPEGGDPIKVTGTTLAVGSPPDLKNPFKIEGTIKIVKDGSETTATFTTTRSKSSFNMQLTCNEKDPDELSSIYVTVSNSQWKTEFDCKQENVCQDVMKIVSTKIVNSFTVGLKNLIDRLGSTGKPELREGEVF